MALPAFLMFLAFGVIPLIGVVLLSFTTWDGIGPIHPSGLTSWKAHSPIRACRTRSGSPSRS